MKEKYIFIDLDGTLLEGKFRQYNCYKDIILKEKGNLIGINKYWKLKQNRIKREEILRMSNYEESDFNFLNQWLEEIETKKYLKMDKLKEGVKETLNRWKFKGYYIVLVTMRRNKENLLWQLKENNIFDSFDEIICYGKNDSKIVNDINAKYNLTKHFKFKEAIFIGDSEEDMNAAKLLGIKSIAITTGIRNKIFLDADGYFNEIKDISLEKYI